MANSTYIRASHAAFVGCFILFGTLWPTVAPAQETIKLPTPASNSQLTAQTFDFVSDGPIGPGWTRPDEIVRTYFHEQLPALFRRTIALSDDVPMQGKLSWIFTGPHAGFTVELTPSKVRLFQRFYNSSALYSGQGNYPEKIVRDDEQQFTGHARTLTVVLDSHLGAGVVEWRNRAQAVLCLRRYKASVDVFRAAK